MTVRERALSVCREYDLLPPGATVLCAVSGGADSVCLLHWLSRQKDLTVRAAHFNHRLRGEESDRDEGFVRGLCESWGIPLTVGQADVAFYAGEQGLSVEEAARNLRYAFLRDTAEAQGCDRIATAHTADDNAETVLLNLVRGAGLKGLGGIPPRRGNIVRPLLSATRREVEAYLDLHRLPHVEDSTNSDEVYTRNKLRAQVMPLLRELNPRAAEHINTSAHQLSQVDQYLNAEARKHLSQVQESPGRVSLPLNVLFQAPQVLRPRMVLQLLDRLEAGRRDLGAPHLEAILSLSPGGSLDLPHGLTARREYDALILTTQPPPPPLEPMALREGDNPVPGTGWTVVLKGPPWPGLVVRSRQTGDVITLQSGHTRSLKRLFIDQRIPRPDRERIPIVADDAGVLAAAGFGPNTGHPRHGQIHIIKEREDTGNEK